MPNYGPESRHQFGAAPLSNPTDIERFSEKYIFCPKTGCWLWQGGKQRGYGKFTVRSKSIKAHRFSYQYYRGDIPPGMFVCHTCDTPACVNPDHLFIGTAKDNARDKEKKGRGNQVRGRDHYCAKLTPEQAMEIFNAKGHNLKIAQAYGVSDSLVRHIKAKRKWKHIHEF